MSIIAHDGALHICRLSLRADEFPQYFAKHRHAYPRTCAVEALGSALIRADFERTAVKNFVKTVCQWGGRAGVAGNVLKYNSTPTITKAMRRAHVLAAQGQIGNGLEALDDLRGLAVSFSSKHLRFLHPDKAVVLDSIISSRLGYPLTVSGYDEFLRDCLVLRDRLNSLGLARQTLAAEPWRVSDVEMAIYAALKGL